MKNNKGNLSAEESISLLIQGNARFINGLKSVETFLSTTKVRELSEVGQKPFCVVVTCSDSRLPIELIFDRGLGDLFVIRTFGNVIDENVVGSIEYALLNFDVNAIVILGHSRSGAIRMTIEKENELPENMSGPIQSIVRRILPSLKRSRLKDKVFNELNRDNPLREKIFRGTCLRNIRNSAREVSRLSALVRERSEKKQLYVVPSLYEMDLGRIRFELGKELYTKVLPSAVESQARTYGSTALHILQSSIRLDSEFIDEQIEKEEVPYAKQKNRAAG